jgi:acyl-[acyl carrier protein]--UDP-N-acetylglucosamine O-acyltransferase
VYRSDLKLSEALERLEPSAREQPALRLFVDFIRGSTRSIIR